MKEIVIKIPEEKWTYAREHNYIDMGGDELANAIINGTPLPKGHGELKDIGKCDRKLFYQQCGGADSLITVKTAFDMLMSLPTIVEADKGE